MKINPYLIFNGDCKAAFTFYAESLQGQIEAMMTFGETPAAEHVPKDLHNLIIHTRLEVGDQTIMGSDTTPDRPTDEHERLFDFAECRQHRRGRTGVFGACPKAAKSKCRWRPPSGRRVLACWSIALACRGWSTAKRISN